jgi:hypothetical protein
MCFKQRWTTDIVPWLMRDTGCTRAQAGISRTFELVIRNRAKSRFGRHDFEADGSIPRRCCELNPAFRKPKALRIFRAMEGAQASDSGEVTIGATTTFTACPRELNRERSQPDLGAPDLRYLRPHEGLIVVSDRVTALASSLVGC